VCRIGDEGLTVPGHLLHTVSVGLGCEPPALHRLRWDATAVLKKRTTAALPNTVHAGSMALYLDFFLTCLNILA